MQTSLFDEPQPTPQTTPPPTCPGCQLRPARWNQARNQYARYCNGNHCSNHQRKCRNCGNTYDRDTNGAGTKYCSARCKQAGYSAGWTTKRATSTKTHPCRICRTPTESNVRMCRNCTKQHRWADTLRRHRAPDHIWQHMTTHGTCMNPGCAADLTGVTKTRNGHWITNCHVDHDHTCCPRGYSCGNCIRGVLCQGCNQALGLLRDNQATISGLALYIQMANAATRP